jgi:hypothetical protein
MQKKEILDSTFCRQQNANDRKITGISVFAASLFSNTTRSILRLKPVHPVSNVTKQNTPCELQ